MQRIAVFVDAGYLYAQSAVCLTGANVNRAQLKLDEAEFVHQIKSLASSLGVGAQLLRIYWYDGARNGMTVEQIVLADMPDVKVRLGSINSAGQQKGVDSLLVTDLIDLARNQAISDAAVVTGDGDMRIAVQIAQSFGVRVHLVGLEPSRASQSQLLRQEADTVHEITRTEILKFMTHLAPVTPLQVQSAPTIAAVAPAIAVLDPFLDAVEKSIDSQLAILTPQDLAQLKQAVSLSRRIPEQYDRKILGTCRALLGRELDDSERRQMRNRAVAFINKSSTP